MKNKTCCVAGHHDIPADQLEYVMQELRFEVEQAIVDGYTHFLTGFTEGTDQFFAETVIAAQRTNIEIDLEAVLPYRYRYNELLCNEKTSSLILDCAEIGFSNEKKVPNGYSINRRIQLQRSSRMIAVYDGRDTGNTLSAIRMAHAHRVIIKEISLWV